MAKSKAHIFVLVPGFMAPTGHDMLKSQWGTAKDFETGGVRLIFPKVSCMGSAHDRACEIFSYVLRRRVDYGREHAMAYNHEQFGEDHSNIDLDKSYPEWNEHNPIHLVGHSFGGNTIRVLTYLLSIDYFKVGSNSRWVKSITTISSPLLGSLLVYVLGAKESKFGAKESPVRKFSIGYNIGVLAHLYTVLTNNGRLLASLGLDFDAGITQFGVLKNGFRGFWKALWGGSNGGGTPAVCVGDNAAQDMTVANTKEYNDLFKKHVDIDNMFEFNFVATSSLTKNYSFLQNVRDNMKKPGISRLYSAGLCIRDYITYDLASRLFNRYNKSNLDKYFEDHAQEDPLDVHLGDSDGLCSAFTQHVPRSYESDEDSFSSQDAYTMTFEMWRDQGKRYKVCPGSYRIEMSEHTHFSIIPYPDNFESQHEFFSVLFRNLKRI